MKGSLRRKMLYSYVAVTVLILAGLSVGISMLLREYFIANKQHELVNKSYELAQAVAGYNEGRMTDSQIKNFINAVDTFLDARVWVLDASRNVVAVSTPRRSGHRSVRMSESQGQGMANNGPQSANQGTGRLMREFSDELDLVFAGQETTKVFYHPLYKENMVIVAVPLLKEDGKVDGAVVLNSPVRGIDRILQQLYYYIGGIGLLALIVTFLSVRYLAKGIVSPLRDMQESAAAMARGDYNIRVGINTDDEVGELGKSLNILAEELTCFVNNTTKAEKLRRDFIANISHELRTPLTVIHGYTEALIDGTVTDAEQAEKYHQLMRDETVRMEALINELLDLSRLQGGNGALEVEALPLAAIAGSVVALLKQRAEQKGVELELAVSAADSQIRGNGDRLTQLLLILLDNALKFTPSGGKVTVGIERTDKGVSLIVRDTGKGILLEDLPFIWERFYKADKSHTRTGTGTGLGLAIAKEIIDRHGASAKVTSRLGEGTVFLIEFPAWQ